MKVAVINYTGTVGKTTIAGHLLAPRMNGAEVFAVESINETAQGLGVDVEVIRGTKFRELFKKLTVLDDAIIDVGASNVEAFLDGMVKFEDSHLEIDYFLVPVTSGTKEQKETIAVITTLSELGIPADRISIIFNRVNDNVADEFRPLLQFVKQAKLCVGNTEAAIYESELFDLMSMRKVTISGALNDQTDYKAKAREEKASGNNPKLMDRYTDLLTIKLGLKPLQRNLDAVFSVLFTKG
jgi:hypothetical protein